MSEIRNPYENYRFQLSFEGGTVVAGFSTASGLTRKTNVVAFHAGGEPQSSRKIPGQADYAPISMRRGITMDTEFQDWAALVVSQPNATELGAEAGLETHRRDIQLVVYDEAGQPMLGYSIHRCWPSEFIALPEFDAESNAVGIESLTLEHEGWERDVRVGAPGE